jgi:rare lipoprotein A (peptidoglycan hydrolase)
VRSSLVIPRDSGWPGPEESAVSAPAAADSSSPGATVLLGMTALCLSLLVACSGNPKPKAYAFPPAETPAVGTVVEGIASWYGPGYDGKKSSSGEVFDQDALTAAHAYWAFGTRVRVTFLATGKSVVVRINDRFPSHKGRAIDLSRGAAKAIGLIGPGTGEVRLEVVE